MQKKGAEIRRKKREKDGAKMELRRDGTINTHPFSYPWPADNKKKEGGRISDFSLIKTRSKHLKLVNPHKPWNY
jgi:hypothetical protein